MDEQTKRYTDALSERIDFLELLFIKRELNKNPPDSAEERKKMLDGF